MESTTYDQGISREVFLTNLAASTLLTPEEIELAAAGSPDADGIALAHALVKAGLLTEYQMDAIGQGRQAELRIGNYHVLDKSIMSESAADSLKHELSQIEAEHPEMRRALEDGDDMHVGSEVMNPRLHIAMHEIVANQIWDDDPPEMWQTAQRLTAAGHPRHDVLHMLASVVSDQVWGTLTQGSPFDIERMRLELAALPEGWEVRGEEWSVERSRNRAEQRAAERRRRS